VVTPASTAIAEPLAALEPMRITRALLEHDAPDLLAALIEEGRAAGVAAERARLKAIDELPVRGHAKLIAAAKYDEPLTADQVAVLAWKAEGTIGADRLEARRTESEAAAKVRQSPPTKNTEDLENEAAKQIAQFANRRRGG
jgi:hypothetical protein